jgi:hypothetical protein
MTDIGTAQNNRTNIVAVITILQCPLSPISIGKVFSILSGYMCYNPYMGIDLPDLRLCLTVSCLQVYLY